MMRPPPRPAMKITKLPEGEGENAQLNKQFCPPAEQAARFLAGTSAESIVILWPKLSSA